MTSRRDVLNKLFKSTALAATGGLAWGTLTISAKGSALALAPRALDEKEFIKACIKCGQCVNDCPYDTLKLADTTSDLFIGTPYFKPRIVPCYMCTDYPCTKACPSGALSESRLIKNTDNKGDINNSRMGLAVIHRESCIAYHGIQCDACYRACPLMGKAITLDFEKNTDTGKHANLQPKVNSDVCTGCGMCEHACVVEKAAIFVLPVDLASGKVGDHYHLIHGNKPEYQQNEKDVPTQDKDTESALDYLNNNEPLAD